MPTPYLTGWLYTPLEMVTDLSAVKAQLTVHPKPFGDEVKAPIPMYDESVPGYIGLPPQFGFDMLPENIEIEDRTSYGSPVTFEKRPDPFDPRAAIGQDEFMADMHEAVANNHTVLAVADTGTGKTVTGLDTIAEMGVTAIVMVHLDRLAKQWKQEAMLHLGLKEDEIGIVQGSKCIWKGKKLVIAMMPTLKNRTYEPEFYEYFGTAIWDEVHRCGAPTCRASLGQFPAAYKFALTATLERSDRCERVYLLYFGSSMVESRQVPCPADIHFVKYRTKNRVWGDDHGTRNQCLALDKRRNKMLVFYIKKMYDEGRHVLGLGDNIEHIETILDLLYEAGIPEKELGQFTSEYTEADGSRKKSKDEYLDWVLKAPRIKLGTYGMFKEGISCAELSGGIELTPRSDLKQAIGRVRRPLPGKVNAVWYSPVDVAFGSLIGYYNKRLKEAKASPAIEVHTIG